ncbi:hypothetical protein Pcinc_017887 [Petrolisthes cinctipes]|uniref:Phosphoglycolate phosphatase n=1 Tax=Petrolisthes cinctipes TaxID=88211 RepID=A0AAE1FND5_PETCI|nr:hypothetical protein Pcinc_017887 [Petrolisthes cinctipes]
MASLPKRITKSSLKSFLDSFDNVLTDCDGVLWTGDDVIGKANTTLNHLQKLGKKVFLVTNNSTKSREDYVLKCEKLGFEIPSKEHIVSSGYVLAEYLRQQNFKKKVYVVGTPGMCKELENVGVSCFHVGGEQTEGNVLNMIADIKLDPEVGAVAVGFDPHFCFPKIMRAGSYLNNPECLFLATNTDERFPVANGPLVFPGTGCLVRCVETVAERPPIIMGKPSPKMFSVISEKNNLLPSRTLMIGDRSNTDILFGKNCGLHTLVVLSGVTSMSDLETWAASTDTEKHRLLADYYLEEIGDLLSLLNADKAE